jgi:hypothetical protein
LKGASNAAACVAGSQSVIDGGRMTVRRRAIGAQELKKEKKINEEHA